MKNVIFECEILKMVQKDRNLAAAHVRKVLPFSVTNELGLENYLSYPCTKFGEKLRLLALTIEQISLQRKSVAVRAHCINPFWL